MPRRSREDDDEQEEDEGNEAYDMEEEEEEQRGGKRSRGGRGKPSRVESFIDDAASEDDDDEEEEEDGEFEDATPIHDGMRTPMHSQAWAPMSPPTWLLAILIIAWITGKMEFLALGEAVQPTSQELHGLGHTKPPLLDQDGRVPLQLVLVMLQETLQARMYLQHIGQAMTSNPASYLPVTPGQPIDSRECWNGYNVSRDEGDNNWPLPDVLVNVSRGCDDEANGVVKEVLPDGSCRVALDSSGSGDELIAFPNELEVVRPKKNDRLKIMNGSMRGVTGKLIGVDGSDGVVTCEGGWHFRREDSRHGDFGQTGNLRWLYRMYRRGNTLFISKCKVVSA